MDRPAELDDVRRYGRRVIRRFVAQAREDERPSFPRLLSEHLVGEPELAVRRPR